MKEMHVIFDLDGTLIDSKQEIIDTYRKVTVEIKPSKPIDFSALDFGETMKSILETIYGDDFDSISKAKIRFSEIYDSSSYEQTKIYPNVNEVIEELYEKKLVLHIATNKRLVPTLKIIESKKLAKCFTSIMASDMIENKLLSKREMVDSICKRFGVEKGFMVGDSPQDIDAGFFANLTTIAIIYGYGNKEKLLKENPNYTIENFVDLPNILIK